MIQAMVAVSAQTEKKGFDDLYHFIENLDVFEYGQEEARAYYIPGHHILLNGKWKFSYGDTPQEIPANFFEEKFSDHEDLEFADRSELLELTQKTDNHITSLANSFEIGNVLRHSSGHYWCAKRGQEYPPQRLVGRGSCHCQ